MSFRWPLDSGRLSGILLRPDSQSRGGVHAHHCLRVTKAGAQELVHSLSWAYGVVPATERFVGKEVELTHFRVWDLDSGGVVLRDEVSVDDKAGFGFGGRDEFEDLADVGERLSSPVLADLAEQTVFDGIPFRSARGIVADGNGEAERSAECVLKRFPPGAATRAVTSSAIRQNEELAGGRVSLASLL